MERYYYLTGTFLNTPGTAGGPGFRDRTLAVKSRKNGRKICFFSLKNKIYGSFPEVGQKQKTEKRERKRERLNNGDNNGQATHGARKHAWRTQAAWAN